MSEILKHMRKKAAMSAETARQNLDPGSLILDLLEYREDIGKLTEETMADLVKIKEQVVITEKLLKKCMPDLKALEVSTQAGKPMKVEVTWAKPDEN